jgi:dihydrofolate reductase/thymidylate synthase
MSITLLAAVVFRKGKFEIGFDNKLLYHLPEDLKNFKNITYGNTVVMGYNTWSSLPKKPLPGRTNIVLTTKKVSEKFKDTIFITLSQFKSSCPMNSNEKYFLIGGGEIYKLFLQDEYLKPKKMILTHIEPEISTESDTFLDPGLIKDYKITGYSELFSGLNLKYRYIYYSLSGDFNQEYTYLRFLTEIREEGISRDDRTGTGTLSLFGNQMKFDISNSSPLLTTKRINFTSVLEELLWMCRGDTNSKILNEKGIKIWDGNTSREFLDSQGLFHYPEGVLGPQYGFLWRHFGAKYDSSFSDTSKCDTSKIGGFDQLKYIENLLKTDPFSRRIMLTAWSPDRLDEQCLPSCHFNCQFYVTLDDNGDKNLSCMFNMRSNDMFLGNPYNLVGYTVLTYILAKRCDMKPKELVYSCGDSHIYKNHLDSVSQQLLRSPRGHPCLELDDSLKTKDWSKMTSEDFKLIGYFPYPVLKAKMAI